MSTGLPDFASATAWLDVHGVIWEWLGIATQADQFGPEWASGGSPWEPPRTADEWVKRIDRDKLALEIALTPDPSHAGMGTRHVGMDWAREMADAVLAALPDLMGGAS